MAYNAAFEHFQIIPIGKDEIANWYALCREICSHRPVALTATEDVRCGC